MALRVVTICVLLAAISAVPVSARYLDPGTGSMLLQAAVAGVAGAALLVRTYWHRLKAFLTRSSGQSESE